MTDHNSNKSTHSNHSNKSNHNSQEIDIESDVSWNNLTKVDTVKKKEDIYQVKLLVCKPRALKVPSVSMRADMLYADMLIC
jgi:hypothetical protein